MACSCKKEYVATLALVVNAREHKFDVMFIECVARLAHVGNVRKHKFDVALIEYVATLAHTKKVDKMEANRFRPKRQTPWRNQ